MGRLSLEDLAAIAGTPPESSLADLARQLGRPYITVAVAAWRMRRAGGWYSRIEWRPCRECGGVFARGPHPRQGHPACMQARAARLRDAWRKRPEVWSRRLGKQAEARVRASEEWRVAHARYLQALNSRDQALTRTSATSRGDRWAEQDDAYLLTHWQESARDQAMTLGRTLWSVRRRRTYLRRLRETTPSLLGPGTAAQAPGALPNKAASASEAQPTAEERRRYARW